MMKIALLSILFLTQTTNAEEIKCADQVGQLASLWKVSPQALLQVQKQKDQTYTLNVSGTESIAVNFKAKNNLISFTHSKDKLEDATIFFNNENCEVSHFVFREPGAEISTAGTECSHYALSAQGNLDLKAKQEEILEDIKEKYVASVNRKQNNTKKTTKNLSAAENSVILRVRKNCQTNTTLANLCAYSNGKKNVYDREEANEAAKEAHSRTYRAKE